jgi:hypothetical protein
MTTRRHITRLALASLALAAAALAGCASMNAPSNMVAMSTTLRAANEVPANTSPATGTVDAVLNKDTNLLRWKVNYTGLTGPASAGHFHGPAAVGANAGVVLGWANADSDSEGSATLTATQAADLMAGRWYANIHTKANPGGEIRGQMMVRN